MHPITDVNFYLCGVCSTVLLKHKHVMAEVHFSTQKCLAVKPLQNLKNLLLKVGEQTKIDLTRDSEVEIQNIVKENRVVNLITK
jgi:hypothetical protein